MDLSKCIPAADGIRFSIPIIAGLIMFTVMMSIVGVWYRRYVTKRQLRRMYERGYGMDDDVMRAVNGEMPARASYPDVIELEPMNNSVLNGSTERTGRTVTTRSTSWKRKFIELWSVIPNLWQGLVHKAKKQ